MSQKSADVIYIVAEVWNQDFHAYHNTVHLLQALTVLENVGVKESIIMLV
jgi:hypothetical protein